MLKTIWTAKFASALVAAAVVFAATPASAQSAATTTGAVRLSIVRAGFIVGMGGGSGTLTFRGRTYPISVGGIGIGSLGIASVRLTGTASNLRNASDIVGTYGAAGAGAAFVGGGQVATLQNERGVVLSLSGAQVGFQVSLGLAGMNLRMRR
jgi:hypothetical protein